MAIASMKKYCIEMEISEISKLESTSSSEIMIHGMPWKVIVCKKGQDAEQSVGVYLHSANTDKSPDWSLWGSASFKLLPFSNDTNPIEFHSLPFVFDASGMGHGTGSLIKWNDLFNQEKKYAKNGAINLEIKVSAENPNDPNRSRLDFKCLHKCCGNSYSATFRRTMTNILNLMAVKSPEFKLRGIPWEIQSSKLRSSHLGILLRLKKVNDTCRMTMTIKLISSKTDVQPIEKCITKEYRYLHDYSTEIVSWAELVKPENGFVNGNSITLEIDINAEKPKVGAESNPKADARTPQMECAVCLEVIDSQELSVTPCGHLFCLACITKVVNDRAICPTCKTAVQLDALRQLFLPAVN